MAESFLIFLDLFLGFELDFLSDPSLDEKIEGFLKAFGVGLSSRSLWDLNLFYRFSQFLFLMLVNVFLIVSYRYCGNWPIRTSTQGERLVGILLGEGFCAHARILLPVCK